MTEYINYSLSYSLRVFLETEMEELIDVQIIYDGVGLSDKSKPFATVRYLHTNKEMLAAGRTDYQDIIRYEIGLFTSSIDELTLLEGKLDKVMRSKYGIPYFQYNDALGTFEDSGNYLIPDVSTFTPIPNESVSEDTYDNHGYLDISFDILIDNATGSISQ